MQSHPFNGNAIKRNRSSADPEKKGNSDDNDFKKNKYKLTKNEWKNENNNHNKKKVKQIKLTITMCDTFNTKFTPF